MLRAQQWSNAGFAAVTSESGCGALRGPGTGLRSVYMGDGCFAPVTGFVKRTCDSETDSCGDDTSTCDECSSENTSYFCDNDSTSSDNILPGLYNTTAPVDDTCSSKPPACAVTCYANLSARVSRPAIGLSLIHI